MSLEKRRQYYLLSAFVATSCLILTRCPLALGQSQPIDERASDSRDLTDVLSISARLISDISDREKKLNSIVRYAALLVLRGDRGLLNMNKGRVEDLGFPLDDFKASALFRSTFVPARLVAMHRFEKEGFDDETATWKGEAGAGPSQISALITIGDFDSAIETLESQLENQKAPFGRVYLKHASLVLAYSVQGVTLRKRRDLMGGSEAFDRAEATLDEMPADNEFEAFFKSSVCEIFAMHLAKGKADDRVRAQRYFRQAADLADRIKDTDKGELNWCELMAVYAKHRNDAGLPEEAKSIVESLRMKIRESDSRGFQEIAAEELCKAEAGAGLLDDAELTFNAIKFPECLTSACLGYAFAKVGKKGKAERYFDRSFGRGRTDEFRAFSQRRRKQMNLALKLYVVAGLPLDRLTEMFQEASDKKEDWVLEGCLSVSEMLLYPQGMFSESRLP